MSSVYQIYKEQGIVGALGSIVGRPISLPVGLSNLLHPPDLNKPLADHSLVDDSGRALSFYDKAPELLAKDLERRRAKMNLQTPEEQKAFNQEADRQYAALDDGRAWARAFDDKARRLNFLDNVPGNAVKDYLDALMSKDPAIRGKAALLLKETGIKPTEVDTRFMMVINREELEHYAKTLDMLAYLAGDHVSSWIVGDPDSHSNYLEQIRELGGTTISNMIGLSNAEPVYSGQAALDRVKDAFGVGRWSFLKGQTTMVLLVGAVALFIIKKV